MTTTEAEERVARAIAKADGMDESMWPNYVTHARDAIAAHLLYLHETAHRVVMDGEGNVERQK